MGVGLHARLLVYSEDGGLVETAMTSDGILAINGHLGHSIGGGEAIGN